MYYKFLLIASFLLSLVNAQVNEKLYKELDKKHVYKPWNKGQKGGSADYGSGTIKSRTAPNRRTYRDDELREMSSIERLERYERYLEKQYRKGKIREVHREEMERYFRRLERQSKSEGRSSDFRKRYRQMQKRSKGKYSNRLPKLKKKRVVEKNYKIDPPDPEDIPDVEVPKAAGAGGGLGQVFLVLGILIIAVVVAYIVYLWLDGRESKGKKGEVKRVSVEDEDISPAEIPKTELELALEKALKNGDYRLAVRVYFTFIMKDLIEKRWIEWEKGKTLSSYQNEMLKRKEHESFSKTVNLFEIVWFGKRRINESDFKMIEGPFKNLLNRLGVR